MAGNRKTFSEEEKIKLLNNPYTFRVSDHRITFTLAFKQYVMSMVDKPGMTSRKIFASAGYDTDIISPRTMKYTVRKIKLEAASGQGLKEPSMPKKPARKRKNPDKEMAELKLRVKYLEQQIEFLKKSEHLRKTGQIPLPRDSS